MTEFSLNNKDLQKILAKTGGILAKNPKSEIYSLLKATITKTGDSAGHGVSEIVFEALGASLYLRSSIVCNVKDPLEKDIEFLFKPELLQDILPLVKDETINFSLDLDTGNLNFKSSKTKQTLRVYNHYLSEFVAPSFDIKELESSDSLEVDFSILAKDYQKGLKISNVSVGQAKFISDPKFLNICFNLSQEGKLTMISTDKYRLSVLNLPINITKDSDLTRVYLFMPKSLQTLASYIEDSTESIRFRLTTDYAWVSVGSNLIALQYSGHEYPDVKKIIPQSFSYIYTIDTQELKDALKQAMVIAKKIEKNKAINLTIDGLGGRMQISSKAPDGSLVETEISIYNYSGAEEVWQQGFNIDYLLDFINQIDEPRLVLEQQAKRLVMSPEGKKDELTYLASGLA